MQQTNKQGSESRSELPSRALNLSLWYPVSLGGKHAVDKAFHAELGLFYGRVGAIHGGALSTGVTIIEREMDGSSLAAIGLMTGASAHGVVISGLGTWTGGRSDGVFVAGGGNLGIGPLRGVDASIGANLRRGPVAGVQIACGMNGSLGDVEGVQTSAGTNLVGGDVNGVQISGFNGVQGKVRGAQFGALNIAQGGLAGLQLGFINVAGDTRGAQVGFINIAKRMQGYPIGVVNVNQSGRFQAMGWTSSLFAANAAIRYVQDHVYTLLGIGWDPGSFKWPEHRDTTSYQVALGVQANPRPVFLDVDLGYAHEGPMSGSRSGDSTSSWHVVRVRGSVGLQVVSWLGGFVGAAMRQEFSHDGARRTRSEFSAGLTFL